MNFWKGKVAVVTGASAGIGASTLVTLVKSGLIGVGLARRSQMVEDLKSQLTDEEKGRLFSYECDISCEKSVKDIFKEIDEKFGGVGVLINNAGIATNHKLLDDEDESNDDIQSLVGTNFLGLLYCTRAAFRMMKKYDSVGYIINISSVLGHIVPHYAGVSPIYNVYPGTKHAITATSEVLRQELTFMKNANVRISNICPGFVETDILRAAGLDDRIPKGAFPTLQSQDIADCVVFVLGTPLHVQINELLVKPVNGH